MDDTAKIALHERYRKAKPLAGLTLFSSCHGPYYWRWIFISRHFPWQTCWCWFLDMCITKPNDFHWRWGWHVRRRADDNKIMNWYLYFGFGCFAYHRQFYQYMVNRNYLKQGTVQ